MSMDLIKSYLIGIGFNVDDASLNNAKQKMNEAEKTVKSFAKDNSNGVASMKKSVGDIGSLVETSLGALSKIFPSMKGPLNEVTGKINAVKKVFNAFSKSVKKDMGEADSAINNFHGKASKKAKGFTANKTKSSKTKNTDTTSASNSEPIDLNDSAIAETSTALTNLSVKSEETGTALESFSSVGSDALVALGTAAAGPIGIIAGGLAAILIAGVALSKFLNGLVQQNLGYQMLAKQLWTTTQNAKEIDMALKTMGVTMQDLWLSPVLLAQFNQLRKDSAELALPSNFTQNIAVVQELGFEFQRLQQAGTLCFQWIGATILQYISGPLAGVTKEINSFVNGFLKDIPTIAAVIGTPIGIVIRLFLDLLEIIGALAQAIEFIVEISLKPLEFILSLLNDIPKPIKDIIAIIAVIALVLASPLAAVLLIILAVDDLLTYIKGGKSVIGDFINGFKSGLGKVGGFFISCWNIIKGFFADITKGAKDLAEPFVEFGKIVEGVFKDIEKFLAPILAPINAVIKAFQAIGDIGSWLKGAGNSIGSFFTQSKVNYTVPSNSTNNTNSTSNSTANSNNRSTNTNTFNVFGTNPTATASTIGKTLTGINIHNLEGVY